MAQDGPDNYATWCGLYGGLVMGNLCLFWVESDYESLTPCALKEDVSTILTVVILGIVDALISTKGVPYL